MKRPRKRLRMFSLLRASINIHYNVSLSERINSFHLQLPEIASAKAPNISHSPARQPSPPGLSDLHTRDLHHLALRDHALGCADASPELTRSTKETVDRRLGAALMGHEGRKVTRARRVSNSAKVGLARLAVQQRQNGSHSEREPCQNEYDSAGWRRHGK